MTDRKPIRRRWWFRLIAGIVVLLVLARLALPFALPRLLNAAVDERGYTLEYSKLDLSLWSGEIELWHLVLAKKGGDEAAPVRDDGSVIALEYALLDADISALFTGNLKVHRVEADGLDVDLHRDSSGAWNFSPLLANNSENSAAETEDAPAPDSTDSATPPEAKPPRAIDFDLPAELAAIRLQHVQLRLRDDATQPPLDMQVECNVRISDVGSETRPMRVEILAHGPELVDVLRLTAHGRTDGSALDASIEMELAGAHLRPIAHLLAPLGIEPVADGINASLNGNVQVTPAPLEAEQEHPTHASVALALAGLTVDGDGIEALAVDQLTVDIPKLSTAAVEGIQVALDGVRGRAARRSDGALQVAGLVLRPVPAAPDAESEEDVVEEEEAGSAASTLVVDELTLSDCLLQFDDSAIHPPAALALEIEQARLANIVIDPSRPDEVLTIEASAGIAGVVDSMKLSGTARPFSETQSFQLDVAAAGIAPAALQPYLNAAGLGTTLENGAFEAHIDAQIAESEEGAMTIDASLTELALTQDGTLFGVTSVALTGAEIGEELVRVENIELAGTELGLSRAEDGALHFLGLFTGVSSDSVAASPNAGRAVPPAGAGETPSTEAESPADPPAETEPTDQSDSVAPPLRIEVDRIAWTGTTLNWRDAALADPLELRFDDLGFELTQLGLGGPIGADQGAPAQLRLWFSAPNLASKLGLEGTIQSRPGPLDLDVDIALVGRGLTLDAVEPYLASVGLESLWSEASLDGSIAAQIRESSEGMHVNAALTDIAFENAGDTSLSLGAVRLEELLASPSGTAIDAVAIEQPNIGIRRDAEGGLHVAGLRWLPPEPAPSDASVAPDATAPTAPSPAGTTPGEETTPSAEAAPSFLTIGSMRIAGAALDWDDAFVTPAVATAARLDLAVDGVALGVPADPARVQLDLALDGALDQMTFAGSVDLDPAKLVLDAQVRANGMRAGALSVYLPEGLECQLTNGLFAVDVDARWSEHEAGGHSGLVSLTELDYRESGATEPALHLSRMHAGIAQFDPDGGLIDVEALQLEGLEFGARRTDELRFEALGFAFELPDEPVQNSLTEPPTDPSSEPVPGDAEASETELATAEDGPAAEADAPGESTPPPLRVTSVRTNVEDFPTVRIGQLDIGIAHMRFEDATAPEAVPFDASFTLTAPDDQVLVSPTPESLPPLRFTLGGSATPIVAAMSAELELTPYAVEPGFDLQLAADGIRGSGLTDVWPALRTQIDGSGLPAGEFRTHVTGAMRLRRRHAADFDLSSGFGFDLDVDGFTLRDQPEGTVLAGFDSLLAEVEAIRPDGAVHVKRVELARPMARLAVEPEGMRALGLLLLNAEPSASDAEGEGQPPDEPAVDEPAPDSSQPPADPGPEIRIDSLLVQGIDVEVRDTSVTPEMVLPLNDLEFEVKRFTTLALTEPRPVRFRAILGADEVSLPVRSEGGSWLTGLASTIGSAVVGGSEPELEQRPAFDEISASGRLLLHPNPRGWTKLNVHGLELGNFRGAAAASGVTLSDGLVDTSLELRFLGDEGLHLVNRNKLEYLDITEPDNGPIKRYLGLPAPLASILFLLKNDSGSHDIPLSVKVGADGISAGAIASAAARTFLELVTDAVASSPFRILGGALDLTGLDFEDEPIDLTDESVSVSFAPGSTQLESEAEAELKSIAALMRKDRKIRLVIQHQFGPEDRARAEQLANPSADEVIELVKRLRLRRGELLRRRDAVAARARANYATGHAASGDEAREELGVIDAQLSHAESALDEVAELLRSGADRRRDRRTTHALRALAAERLEVLKTALMQSGIPSIGSRLQLRRARVEDVGEDIASISLTPKPR